MTALPPVFNFEKWITEHREELKPPVNNRVMWREGEHFIVQVVGGPNERTDYHIEPYEEWFYQYKGNMHVNVQTDEGVQRVDIREGDMWLLPAGMPHSPQRPEPGSIGIVLERIREEGVDETFRWYCFECNAPVHERTLHVSDIVKDLPPVMIEFFENEDLRHCPQCGAVHPGRKPKAESA
ncbi:3-hydroxyanthranilate 3,4-dioxygenase [Granulicoccus sp. GXG6511]|uniref:3-hydroxyanthranilate 3,4-dioxygenase n=1 Tax=Granulicoccus sp. GXG6511 TaxID=3381351 RepID=UPI003D7C5F0A